jgi:hypothetical protein
MEDTRARNQITCDGRYSYVDLEHILPNRVLTYITYLLCCYASVSTVLKMVHDRLAMYDRFNDKGAHSTKWFKITENFLKLAFIGDHHKVKCPCNRCQNKRMLFEYEMSGHITKQGFMSNYLAWHKHEVV